MNVLILTDKGSGDAEGVSAATRVEEAMTKTGTPCKVTAARDAFFDYEQKTGMVRGFRWEDWATHAAIAFDGFVRPYSKCLGHVNANIIAKAIEYGKPVVYLPETGLGEAVMAVVASDPENYKSGWLVICAAVVCVDE